MIDLDFLKEQCGESEELMQQMLELFTQTAPNHIQIIKDEFHTNDADALAKAVHAFLSSLKILNAERAILLGSNIEKLLIEGTSPGLLLDNVNELVHLSEQLVEEAKITKI
jgi:HPt (histidine-containing phosphotransfer) domain-containing protein